jgi:magnesium transporter
VARKIDKYDLFAIPVLDASERLVGIVTHDDAMDILRKENTEDMLAFGGVASDAEADDEPYWQSRIFGVVRRRINWLLMLFLAESFTGNVLRYFQWVEKAIPDLSLYVPLLIGTGGNAGSQTVSTIIRGLALGEIQPSQARRVVFREFLTAAMLGTLLGTLGFFYSWLFRGQSLTFAIVIGLTILGICLWANSVGALVPLLARRLGIDPAVVSAPLITTLVDATGLVIYFTIAQALLGTSKR